ncbi:tetratricopeptide repeat protein [Pseudomonas zhanjiangensis]|uniref:Ancillary SecYEG translocon subunit n=1 Tax=Pseudomonas zhanjiangensis TaxID=3239015 RepID=A0ABV3YT34_9PSED
MVSRTEEEELAVIKEWWARNGQPLLTGSVLALVIVFGWQGWQKYQTNQAEGASQLYQQLLETALNPSGEPDAAKVAELANRLKNDFAGSHYAQYGRLFVAKVAVEAGEPADAVAELEAIIAEPADDNLAELARQRLARVLASQDKTAEGLALLEADVDQAYLASREELKGDLLVLLGRNDEAHAAYMKAKAALSEDAAVGGLQMKLDDLAKGDA